MEDGVICFYVNVDVDVEWGYDFDEQSSVGFVSVDMLMLFFSMGLYLFEFFVVMLFSNGI